MTIAICTVALLGGLLVLPGGSSSRRRTRGRISQPAAVVASALCGALIALLLTALPVVAVIAAPVSGMLPSVFARRRTRARVRRASLAWPSILDDITSALRSGSDIGQAMNLAGSHAPAELQPAFTVFREQYAASASFERAMQAMVEHATDPVLIQIQRALVTARSVGGHDLTRVLRALSDFVRSDLHVRGEIAARQSWTVNSARLAVAAPWLVLLLLASRPATADAYSTLTGASLLVGVAAGSAIAYAAMMRIARLDGVAR